MKTIDLSKNKKLNTKLDLNQVSLASKTALELVEKQGGQSPAHKKKLIEKAITTLSEDQQTPLSTRQSLLEQLQKQYVELFNPNNCPEEYQQLKQEIRFLGAWSEYSFALLAQRLKKVRDLRLYEKDGYKDFKSFIKEQLPFNRQSTYNYISLIEVFGVQTFGHQKESPFPYAKLIPTLPLLKSSLDIPKEQLKKEFIQAAQKESARSLMARVAIYKEQFGWSTPMGEGKNKGLGTEKPSHPSSDHWDQYLQQLQEKIESLQDKKAKQILQWAYRLAQKYSPS